MKNNFIKTLAALALVGFLSAPSVADSAADKGLEIAREADRRDTGFVDNTAELLMILRNRQGQESKRNMKLKTLEQKNDGDKSMVVFERPLDVKGTALLTYSHKDGQDDQWLYLPALKRVKRISSSNKAGPFMGSEFAYEDMSSQEVDKYKWKYLKDDGDNFVVERVPTYKGTGYSRQVIWLDKTHYRVMKSESYDRKKSKLKTLTMSGYKQYAGKFWRPAKMEMVNHQTGKSTVLEWSDYKFKTGLKDSAFTKSQLKRAK